jgi:hypothetical protein
MNIDNDYLLCMEWYEKLEEIMERKEIAKWLITPNNTFENQIPWNMISKGDTKSLNKMIEKLKSGNPL